MIKIKEEKSLIGMTERVYVCTFCSSEHRFFYLSPKKCTSCGKDLPDMTRLWDEGDYKVKYHFREGLR